MKLGSGTNYVGSYTKVQHKTSVSCLRQVLQRSPFNCTAKHIERRLHGCTWIRNPKSARIRTIRGISVPFDLMNTTSSIQTIPTKPGQFPAVTSVPDL
jgi:hypothetical protein